MTKTANESDGEPSSIINQERECIVFADADTMSSFLWLGMFNLFILLFQKLKVEIVIPQQVFEEMSYSRRTREKLAIPARKEAEKGMLSIQDIEVLTPEYESYVDFTSSGLGSGESAALSLAIHSNKSASIASNNLRDVHQIAKMHHLKIWTTPTIIRACVENGILQNDEAETLWEKMILDGTKLPFHTYKEYVARGKI